MTPSQIAHLLPYFTAIDCPTIDLSRGLFGCPGRHLHSTPNADTDCKLFDNGNGFFQLHCVHTGGCRPTIEMANSALAHYARQDTGRPLSASSIVANLRVPKPTLRMAEDDTELRQTIQQEFSWSYSEIVSDSDDAIDEPVEQHYLQLLGLFDDEDIVWCGRDVFDTGSRKHACRFRRVKEWLGARECPGPFTCPSTFKHGTYSRRAANVLAPRFLVVESDTLSRDEIGAIFRWLDSAVGIRLRAVVDTGGKSLHGWFDYPPERVLAQLTKWMPRLGCDPALFKPTQPCRLPGAARGDAYQRLIFIR